ncbi:MAG: XRE family transcriptional regulator [Desulfobacteraceae bacterium]|jgi:quercetin dioxygenase-like cupin family protein
MANDNSKPPINVDYFEDLTGKIEGRAEAPCEQIGGRIKKLREQKGLSIAELSQLTGFDEKMLQDIESGDVCPQLGTVIKLSKALDSALQRLISEEGRHLYIVTRASERKEITRSTTKKGQRAAYTYMSLAPEVKGRHMEPLIVELEALPDDDRSVHEGDEFIYVLQGEVMLDIGDDHFELRPGDSAYYLSTTPHLIRAKEGKAKILAVIYSS